MAKSEAVTKTQAVADYLKTHRKAEVAEVVEALKKQGVTITAGHVSNIKSKLKRRRRVRRAAKTAPGVAVPAEAATMAPEKVVAPGATIALEHVKAVARTVQTMGGFSRLNELLNVIREVGGLKKFRDLLDAIAAPEPDDIPF